MPPEREKRRLPGFDVRLWLLILITALFSFNIFGGFKSSLPCEFTDEDLSIAITDDGWLLFKGNYTYKNTGQPFDNQVKYVVYSGPEQIEPGMIEVSESSPGHQGHVKHQYGNGAIFYNLQLDRGQTKTITIKFMQQLSGQQARVRVSRPWTWNLESFKMNITMPKGIAMKKCSYKMENSAEGYRFEAFKYRPRHDLVFSWLPPSEKCVLLFTRQ